MKNFSINLSILLLFLVSTISCAQTVEDSPEITSEEIYEHIKYLSSDELEGRMTGTDALMEAAEYLKKHFEEAGLKPLFDGSYFQEFPFIEGIKYGENNSFSITVGERTEELEKVESYIVVPFSDDMEIEGNLVFAGYGISASDLEYDDYENIDVTDKIVIVLRNHPDHDTPHSEFEQYAPLRLKATTARDKGAAGIIFVNGINYDEDKFIDFKYDRGGAVTEIASIQMERRILDYIFEQNGMTLEEIQSEIDEKNKPNSVELSNASVKIETDVDEIEKMSWNVGAYLEANEDGNNDEYLVIGAHFDHLGWGNQNSLYMGDEPLIHNGADDNASGTTGLLELAEKFASNKDQLKRKVVFTAFSGEELGLLGSNYLVNHFPIPIENAVTMINMDMIGRLNEENSLIVYGTGTAPDWEDLLNEKNQFDFKLTFNEEGFGPSDHSSFYGKKMPVLFFFTGTHTDYHKPSDDYDKINAEGQEKIVKYVYDVATDIVNDDTKPEYLAVERKDKGKMTGTRVWVGTIPDFSGGEDGYKITGVTEGSPAETAGLEGGDIIVQFGKKKISNIYDFTYALSDYVPGDVVEVVVKRGEEEKTFEIELGTR